MFLLDRINYWASNTPNSTAIKFANEQITFSSLQGNVQNTIALLENTYDIKSGDRVAYLGLNHPHMLYLVFACSHLGAIFTPFNTRLANDEYRYLCKNAEPKVCFFDVNFETVANKLDGESCAFVPKNNLNREASNNSLPDISTDAHAPLLLVYTSGTTGTPKGVLLSNAAVAANIENGNAFYDFKPDQNVLITLPLFHVGGLCILLLPALTHGATIHLHSKFDPSEAIRCLNEDKITTTILVPAQMAAMMAQESWATAVMSSMKYVVVGSSLIPMAQIKTWHSKNIPVSQIYGSTETGPTAIGLHTDHAFLKEGSAGQAAKLCSVEIRHPDHSKCKTGENGDIWVKGPNILSGYWRNQGETDLVLQDGWYNTGDIGHMDEDGFYWIVDRSKDVIISGGENIYPAEIETVALQHPAVQAIAVVGKVDPHWGETPVAAIELAQNSALNEQELREFLTDKIAKYKQPKSMMIFDSLPRNGMGKIEKSTLREIINS